MRELIIHMHGSARGARYIFRSDELCAAAYFAIKDAMKSYRPYGNDKDNAVSVKADSGEITLKLEHLSAVSFEDPAGSFDLQLDWAERNGKFERKFREAASLDKIAKD